MTNLKIRQKLNYNRKQFKAIMNREERDFLNNLKSSINDWRYSYECYHEQGYFCVDITIDDIDPNEILRLIASDKKVEGDKIKFILLKKVGKAIIDTSVTKDEIMSGIQEIYFSEEDEHE